MFAKRWVKSDNFSTSSFINIFVDYIIHIYIILSSMIFYVIILIIVMFIGF